jgi:hypothetical protein
MNPKREIKNENSKECFWEGLRGCKNGDGERTESDEREKG